MITVSTRATTVIFDALMLWIRAVLAACCSGAFGHSAAQTRRLEIEPVEGGLEELIKKLEQ